MTLKKWIAVPMMLSLSMSANAEPTCKPLIESCDKALAAQKEQIQIRDLRIKESTSQIDELTKTVKEKDEKLSSIFRNPWVYLGVGVLAGALLFRR